MDPIYIYTSTSNGYLDSRIGVLKDVISAEYRENLNFEKTLNFNTVLDTKTSNLLGINTMYVCNGQEFDTSSFEKQMTSDNTFLVNISAEHISYRLSEIQYIKSDITETLWKLGEKVTELTGSIGYGFEGKVNDINSDNVPTILVQNGGANYLSGEIITIIGSESGATTKITIVETDQGRIISVREPTEDELNGSNLPEAEWTPGIYEQQWTSGEGTGFSIVVTSIKRITSSSGSSTIIGSASSLSSNKNNKEIYFYIKNRGSKTYKIGDEIIVGDPIYTSQNPAPYDETKYRRRLAKMNVSNLKGGLIISTSTPGEDETEEVDPNKQGSVGDVSNFVSNASIPTGTEEPGTGEISESENYNFNKTGTLTQIVNEILYRTNFNLGESVPGYAGIVTFLSNSTNIKALLTDFVTWIHDYGYSNSDLIFDNKTLHFYVINYTNNQFVFRSNNVVTISYSVDKHEKDDEGNYGMTYSCQPIIFPEGIKLADSIHVLNEDLGIDQTLRVSSLNFNPYNLFECEVEVSNLLKNKNILVSRTQVNVEKEVENVLNKISFEDKSKGSTGVNVGSTTSDNDTEGGVLPSFSPEQAGEYVSVDKDGNLITTQANDNLDPLIINQLLSNVLNSNTASIGVLTASSLNSYEMESKIIKTTNNDYFTYLYGGNLVTTNDPTYLDSELNITKPFLFLYGGEGYHVNDTLTVTGMVSGQTYSNIKVTSIFNKSISAFIINNEPSSTFVNSELLTQNGGSTSGTNFIGVIRSVKNNTPVISMRSGGQNFNVGDTVTLKGKKSNATIEIKITATRSGVVSNIDSGSPDLTGWTACETANASGGNGSGLVVIASPYFTDNNVPPIEIYTAYMKQSQISVMPDPSNPATVKCLTRFGQINPTDGAIDLPMDLSRESEDLTYALGVTKGYPVIRFIEITNILTMDHIPSQVEIDYMLPGSVLFIYDPMVPLDPA